MKIDQYKLTWMIVIITGIFGIIIYPFFTKDDLSMFFTKLADISLFMFFGFVFIKFFMTKETRVEEKIFDNSIALAILIGSVLLSIAYIVAK